MKTKIYKKGNFPYVNYDQTDSGRNIGGSLAKKFVRAESHLFKDLFEELRKNSYCTYDTYINELIKEGYEPKYISTLLKRARSGIDNRPEMEAMCCKLANLFGVKTSFCVPYRDDEDDYIMSVDFIGKDEEFVCMDTEKDLEGDFAGWYYHIIRNVQDIAKEYRIEERQLNHDILNITTDFANLFFFKELIIQDADFRPGNTGILINKAKKSVRLAPMFDTEFSFTKLGARQYDLEAFSALCFLYREYPKLLDNLIQNYIEVAKSPKAAQIINKSLNDSDGFKTGVLFGIESSVDRLEELYNEIKDSYDLHY